MSRKRKARDGNTPLLAGVPKRLHCSSPGPDRRSDGSLYIANWLRYWLLLKSRPCLLWFIPALLRSLQVVAHAANQQLRPETLP
jgi:hypothetical protein